MLGIGPLEQVPDRHRGTQAVGPCGTLGEDLADHVVSYVATRVPAAERTRLPDPGLEGRSVDRAVVAGPREPGLLEQQVVGQQRHCLSNVLTLDPPLRRVLSRGPIL